MLDFENIKTQTVIDAAKAMCLAAKTAPKARGTDNLVIKIADKEDIKLLSDKLEELYVKTGQEFLHRDSANILLCEAMLLVGSRNAALGLDCGYCGFESCAAKPKSVPCFFNSNDLGIAVGSACSIAAAWKVDSRVMFSAGCAAKELNMLEGCPSVLAIALSASGKNVFFDRK